MQTRSNYLVAAFVSFMIHASIILYLTDFFYFEKQKRPVLSKPVNVELLFETEIKKSPKPKFEQNISSNPIPENVIKEENKIELSSLIQDTNILNLIQEDQAIQNQSEDTLINEFSNLIIKSIQSAWINPQNIQDGLICDIRMTINKNGRVIKIDLVKSSGNIRFDNSALKAISRVETFSFFNRIPFNIYQSDFKNILITFNPS